MAYERKKNCAVTFNKYKKKYRYYKFLKRPTVYSIEIEINKTKNFDL